ncbi:MAG: glycosyltransferase [Bacteroidota bacterium]|jgi:glycosyltransferase involved in cell wall biosynthesis|nr:glycosyltransferase [Bacteroidota bacterium]NLS98634.1 glycosyltransferase [Bacteroidales bacterium]HNZ68462.1 glycosyltransferase [Prolixibacteraceae bacterium]HOC86313.1 glycosyltransferase [Prolixibacteraceae bacterium]HOG95582.1 glycosyltransferase [Prolixibacteraceae bacterium]
MPQELLFFFQNATWTDFLLPGLAALTWLLLLLYSLFNYFRLSVYKIPPSGGESLPISVIMVERNEEEFLRKNLPGWLSLGYPAYELLVVDDFSQDDSLITLGGLKLRYPWLKMTGLNQETRYSQKLSRNLALKAITSDQAVFVNPSMEMPDHHWLPAISSSFGRGRQMTVGYTAILPSPGFYHRLYRVESFFQQTESMAWCLNGLPFVANEENIAFKKQGYFDINGFAGYMREEYLNMEIIFNRIIRRRKTSVLPASNLVLRKEFHAGKREWRELLHRSFRLKSTLGFFKRSVLAFFGMLKMALLPLFILCVVLYPVLWIPLLALLTLLGIIMVISILRLQKRLNEPKIFIPSLIYGIIAPYIKVVVRWGFNYRMRNR